MWPLIFTLDAPPSANERIIAYIHEAIRQASAALDWDAVRDWMDALELEEHAAQMAEMARWN